MPRKNPVPETERAIGARLKKFRREILGMDRPAMALKLGIDSNQLARHEHGRVPLRFELADKIGRVFNLNQVWLATGKRQEKPYMFAPEEVLSRIPPGMSFWDAYNTHLLPAFKDTERFSMFSMMAIMSDEPPVFTRGIDDRFYLQKVLELIEGQFQRIPRKIRGEFLRRLIRVVSRFGIDFDEQHNPAQKRPKK